MAISGNRWRQSAGMLPASLILLLPNVIDSVSADNNFLTGANDVIAVEGEEGVINALPFAVQFGKKDIWLPR